MKNTIWLRCPACAAEMLAKRIPTDPPEAVAVEVHCDRHGSIDTERVMPRYLDAAGDVIGRAA